ncbi:hypothetical protein AB0G02_31940 [Actinosynnema sp. NPDC023658]
MTGFDPTFPDDRHGTEAERRRAFDLGRLVRALGEPLRRDAAARRS